MLVILKDACAIVGGPPALAKALGIRRQAFYGWHRVPANRVLEIERATAGQITRHQLRPDLYPDERGAKKGRAA